MEYFGLCSSISTSTIHRRSLLRHPVASFRSKSITDPRALRLLPNTSVLRLPCLFPFEAFDFLRRSRLRAVSCMTTASMGEPTPAPISACFGARVKGPRSLEHHMCSRSMLPRLHSAPCMPATLREAQVRTDRPSRRKFLRPSSAARFASSVRQMMFGWTSTERATIYVDRPVSHTLYSGTAGTRPYADLFSCAMFNSTADTWTQLQRSPRPHPRYACLSLSKYRASQSCLVGSSCVHVDRRFQAIESRWACSPSTSLA